MLIIHNPECFTQKENNMSPKTMPSRIVKILLLTATRALVLSLSQAAHADTVAFTANFTGGSTAPVPSGDCPPASPLIVNISGSGTLVPFGAATNVQSQCINPADFSFTNGQFTNTLTATGDTFFGTYTGNLVPPADPTSPIFGINGMFTITGGTGIFAGATGGGLATGIQNVATGNFALNLNGLITVQNLTAVPEPTTIFLLGTGLAGVAAKVRQRRQANARGISEEQP